MQIKTRSELQKFLGYKKGVVSISGVSEGRVAPVAAIIAENKDRQCLIITASYVRARKLAEDIAFFTDKKIYVIPSEEQIFFKYEAKSYSYLEERLKAIIALLKNEDCIVITPIFGAVQKMPPKTIFEKNVLKLESGKSADVGRIKRALAFMGYERANIVEAKGQYGVRGGIVDVFPADFDYPCRIELFDTEIDSLRSFDPVSQRSIENLKAVAIYPAQMVVSDSDIFSSAAVRIGQAYEDYAEGKNDALKEKILQRRDRLVEYIQTGTNIQVLENYIHYFYKKTEHLWDYLSDEGIVVLDDYDRILEKLEFSQQETEEDFETTVSRGEAIPLDFELRIEKENFNVIYDHKLTFLVTPFQKVISGIENLVGSISLNSRQTTIYHGKMDLLEEELARYGKKGFDIQIACSTSERVSNVKHFLERNSFDSKVKVVLGVLSAGMEFPDDRYVVISDADIFTQAKHRRTRTSRSDASPIRAFSDISAGDYVVHENHGIGQFIGIEQLCIQESKKDYLKIKYGGEDMLYIPVEQMDLIQKYVGAEGATPKVNKLSGGEWKKTKAKVKAAIEDMAEELLELSAARSMEKGFSFSPDTPWQREFEDLFPYEETKDQLRAVKEIKKDMEKDIAMDRLLCGDVGYGKTEVAARAVFKCIAEGKQAAILVPTTILANQHYYTFRERMENFPFEIEMLSRFRTDKQQDEIIKRMKKGSIDVVIGTHRLLSKDIGFKDLGLLVIDEEQRFGVQHKEAIKMLRKSVDVLALSATPIPRTLHMSLAGIRDMSVIEEPPEERFPIQTYVMEQEDDIIRESIYRELDRDGQVYIVFNRVIGIKRIAAKIKELVPEAKIAVAHGQMNERELEDIMFDFTHHKYNVLVATTIIESGLDIPNVNTMVIMDSDRFGLSQLYQLRGRVGRSNRIAYAYLLHQKEKVLTEPAEKRLRAIKEFTEFGSGFRIAMRDLEIRGAGNLLGTEQSGHMMMIGYELYCKLLEEAVARLGGQVATREEAYEASMEIEVDAYIPNNYISDELMKLSMYKKIASIKTKLDVDEVLDELMDRFGDVPLVVSNLLKISYIKAFSEKAGVIRIREEKGKFVCEFNEKNCLSAQLLFKLAADYGPAILISARQKPVIKCSYKKEKDKMHEIAAFVEKLLSESY